MFHRLSHTAHRAISIHNILEVSWTSYKMNSKRSQSLIKASKSFSIHKVCFHDRGLFKFLCFSASEWNNLQAHNVCKCVCISVCYCFWVFFRQSWADLWLYTFSARHQRSSALLISTPPLVCSCSVHPQRAMKFLHRTDRLLYNLTQHGARAGAETIAR